MIKFEHVTKRFKSDLLSQAFTALDDVSFEVPAGSMVGFLGANGAGKTTSLKIIMDFIRPCSGAVHFSESLGTNKLDIFKNIGFLPERPYFYPTLIGRDFLFFMGKLSGLGNSEISDQISKWAPRFRIEHALNRELKTYSKGMLQRIGFMATILHHPKIVILDEPLSGLDPIGRKELKDVIIEVHREGKTVFFSSHIVPDIEEICDRVIFLKEGKLAYSGAVRTLIDNSKTLHYLVSVRADESFSPQTNYIESLALPDSIRKFTIDPTLKDSFVSEMVNRDISIQAIEMKKLNLEEIFYSTKG